MVEGGGGGPEEDEAGDVLGAVDEAGVDPEVDGGGHAVDDAHEAKDADEKDAVDDVEPRLLHPHLDQEPAGGRRPRHAGRGAQGR